MLLRKTFQNPLRYSKRFFHIFNRHNEKAEATLGPHAHFPVQKLPTLPYSLEEGLAPAISSKQLDFHYNKHHMTYVNKLNELIAGTKYEQMALSDIIIDTAGSKEKIKIFNNAAQHFNHSFFWKCMKPGGSEIPKRFQAALEKQFGSVEKFKEQFVKETVEIFGSGWCWLVSDDEGKELKIWTGSNADTPITQNLVPLLTCDAWEHAYYLDWQNRRKEYVENFFKVVDWSTPAMIYAKLNPD